MKHLKTLLLIFAASLMLVACGSGGGSDSGDDPAGNKSSDIVGTWEMSELVEDGVSKDLTGWQLVLEVTDTTYFVNDSNCLERGTYSVDGSTMSIVVTSVDPDGEDCETVGDSGTLPYTVNDTTLILNDRGDILTFTRI